MLEILFILILLGSATAMAVMMFVKIPALVKLNPSADGRKSDSFQNIKERSRSILKLFSKERLLYKFLSSFKVLILKTEKKTSTLLANLRQKSIDEKNKFSDDYWKKLKRKK
ncbi:hypothetical protein KKC65_02920 [Patescibacteria group bacterium]|nr:hypothetical protein [Patescibacteria group bacterium]